MMELWQKLRHLRERAGVTQKELADALPIKVSRVSIGFWESDNPDSRTEPRKAFREALAAYYGMTVSELMSNDNPSNNVSDLSGRYDGRMSRIPIIDIVQAGNPSDYADPYEAGDSSEWIPVIDIVSEETFALRVDGTSMTQDGKEPSYPHGSIIICEPDLAGDVRIGDDVIAKILADDTRVFKSFDMIDGKPVLVPLNSQYPVIHAEFEVLAVVVQMIVKRR